MGAAQQNHTRFYDMLAHALKAPFDRSRRLGGKSRGDNKFWALREVNFEVQRGEVLGIIGRNGSGKSTLLKILSRITAPTRGRATVCGRMASLLEVGTGFHPELSGRENIFLNATILGMRRESIKKRFDEIVAFSGVEQFIDTPVKRYSSGMYVRLAFAVAAYIDADVLLVDEVLAVGDAEFQKRCVAKMKDVAGEGRAVLVVSHALSTLRALCSSGMILESGSCSPVDRIDRIVERYLESNSQSIHKPLDMHIDNVDFMLRSVTVKQDGLAASVAISSSPINVELDFELGSNVALEELSVGFDLIRDDGTPLFRTLDTDLGARKPNLRVGRQTLTCTIPSNLLHEGRYLLGIRAGERNRRWFITEEIHTSFELMLDPTNRPFWVGVARSNRPGEILPVLDWHADSR